MAPLLVLISISNISGEFPYLYMFSKGSFESISRLCKTETIPVEAAEIAKDMSKKGIYVLAVACKNLNFMYGEGDKSCYEIIGAGGGKGQNNIDKILELAKRKDLENDLTFLGFIYFKNKLKSTTPGAIQELKKGKIKCIIITGDSVWTGVKIASECGIIDGEKFTVVVGDVKDESNYIYN